METSDDPVLRIGELSRRVGVSDHVLRAWEHRYGLLRPVRSAGGFRLYTHADEQRVRRMQAHLARGLSAAQAARATLAETAAPTPPDATGGGLAASTGALARALERYDEPGAQAALDELLNAFSVESVLRDALVPYLHELGTRWERGEISVAQEHFATHVLRGRLVSMSRGWGLGAGPRAVLACPPGELHDLGLLAFGIALHRAGWRIAYLGASTPVEEVENAVRELRPSLVVVTATTHDAFTGVAAALSALAGTVPLAVAGAGAGPALAEDIGARLLDEDPVTAAEQVVGT